MHETVFYVAMVWMAGLLCVTVLYMVRAHSPTVRILALDTVTIMFIGLLVLYADWRRVPYYLDAALVLALVSFLATLAAARYHSEGRVF
jgi:multisubunit Na+/H+ antiporter MnhF subunit